MLNYMLYVRGNRRDYDSWAAMGNYGWSYDEVLPYFIKSEDNRNPYLAKSKYHGTGGPLTVQEAPYHTPLAAAFAQGGVELGRTAFFHIQTDLLYVSIQPAGYEIRDCNGELQTGFMVGRLTRSQTVP